MTYKELADIILRNRQTIIKVTVFSAAAIFLILFFVYPVTYNAPVTILPPEGKTEMGALSSLLGSQDLNSLLPGGSSGANPQLYMEMLKSRSAAEYVVEKNGLVKYYNAAGVFEAAKDLQEDLQVSLSKEGIITLSVETKTPWLPLIFGNKQASKKLAADLSNSYTEALDVINREKLSSKAKRARQYIENQLTQTKVQLDSVENQLMAFQKSNKAISLPEQVQAAIKSAADLKTEIVKTEVEVGMMQSNLREDNRSLIALKNKLDELRAQYSKMEMGNQDYLVAFKQVPELGRDLASLVREVKIQNEVYVMLQQQYYKEKIQENRDIPTIEILDAAIPPLKASGPRVIFSSFAGGLFVFLFVCLVFVLDEKKIISLRNKS